MQIIFFRAFNTMETGACFNKEHHLHATFGIIYLLTSLIASTGNGFLLYIVKRDPLKLFNKPTNVVNIFSALNHFFSGLIVLPLIGINSILTSQGIPNEVAKLFENVLVSFVATNESVLLVILFLERYTAFVFPLLNRHYVTITRARRICTSSTITCLLFSCILFVGVSEYVFYLLILPLFILLPCFLMMIVLAAGFCGLKRRAQVIPGNTRELSLNQNKTKRNLQFRKYLLAATRGTLAAVLPLVFYCVVKFVGLSEAEFSTSSCYDLLEHLSFVFLFFSSAVTPIIVFLKIPVYERSARHLWQRRKKGIV